jgi:parallel beta-helix repeat protein
LLTLCALLPALAAAAETRIFIKRDTVVSATILVPESTTMTIAPGVRIEFAAFEKFVVMGLLIAQGTADKPIVITCSGRPRGSAAPPCWHGLVIYGPKAHALFTYCRIEGAYKNVVWESRPVFELCEFTGNHYALYCLKKASPHVKNCRIYRNAYGVVSDFSSPILLDNVITENLIGVQLQLSGQAIAGKNTITGNRTDVRTERCLDQATDPLSLQYLWDVMRELY